MMGRSVQGKDQMFIKGYVFLYFEKIWVKILPKI